MRGARNLSRIAGAAAASACALTIAACGGDDSPIEPIESTSSTTSTTEGGTIAQADFIAAADPLCAEANSAIANSGEDSAGISQESSITQGLLTDLQGIGDGDDPDGSLADFYSALNDEIRILKQQVTATNEGDTTTVASLETDLDAAKSDAATAASSYGFEDCGGTGTTLPSDTGDSTSTTPGSVTTTPAPVTPAPVTPAPVTPTPVDPGDTGGGTPPVTPPPTPTPTPTPDPGGSSGGVGPG